MKHTKLLLTLVSSAAMFAGNASAADPCIGCGDEVNLVQEYNTNTAVISQTNPSSAKADRNVVNAYQGWDGNVMHVSQKGSRNETHAHQYGSGGNYIDSSITGNDNKVSIEQGWKPIKMAYGTKASAHIAGNGSSISVNQEGNYMESYNVNMGDNSHIYVKQTSGQWAYSDVKSIGNNNRINVQQVQNNTSTIWNEGSNNQIDVNQNNTFDPWWNNTSNIEVINANNTKVSVKQDGGMHVAGVDIRNGNNNVANIDQTDGGRGVGSKAYITIRKNNNEANIKQTGMKQTASSYIDGNDNDTYISQDGVENTAASSITGSNNRHNIVQSGTKNNAWANTTGNRNVVEISQTGEGLTAGVIQNGDCQTANITQVGTNLQGYIDQARFGAVANLSQTGVGHYAAITQK